jgi:tetratricopeptide (TPR) repeat protein
LVQSAYEWNWAAAEASFQKAMELQPGLALTYLPLAVCCLLPQLRLEEACRTAEKGLSLDPYNPLSQAQMIYVYAVAGRYDDALRLQAFAREIHPSYAPLFYSGGLTYETQGQFDQAIGCYRHAIEVAGALPATAGALAYVLALSGETEEAHRVVQQLLAMPEQPAFDIATVYLGLREDSEALRWLEIAAGQRNLRMVMVPCDPRFRRRLGNDTRFQAILRRMGLQAATTAI